MTLTASEIRVGITGSVNVAPVGSTLPTDSTAALDAAFTALGYATNDGITQGHADTVTNVVAWQNAQVVRAITSESITTVNFTLMQTNTAVLEEFYPGSVVDAPTAGNFRLQGKPKVSQQRSWVFDFIDGAIVYRLLFGLAELTQRGDVVRKNDQVVAYPFTLTSYPDANNNIFELFTTDTAMAAA